MIKHFLFRNILLNNCYQRRYLIVPHKNYLLFGNPKNILAIFILNECLSSTH